MTQTTNQRRYACHIKQSRVKIQADGSGDIFTLFIHGIFGIKSAFVSS